MNFLSNCDLSANDNGIYVDVLVENKYIRIKSNLKYTLVLMPSAVAGFFVIIFTATVSGSSAFLCRVRTSLSVVATLPANAVLSGIFAIPSSIIHFVPLPSVLGPSGIVAPRIASVTSIILSVFLSLQMVEDMLSMF